AHTYPSTFYLTPTSPPPNTTLFPYTTLFRSRAAQGAARTHESTGRGVHPAGHRSGARQVPRSTSRPGGPAPSVTLTSAGPRVVSDRKSTRLNSSHRTISYAVFCLKKKK